MPTIPLAGDDKAEIRDPETLTGNDVDEVMALAGTVGIDPREIGKTEFLKVISVIRRALVVVLTESWTLPSEITMETVGAMPMRQLRALYKAVEPALADVMPEEIDPNSDGS